MDLHVATVETATTKHIENLGLGKKRRKISKTLKKSSHGVRQTPVYPTGTFLKRMIRAATRCGSTFITHHMYSRGWETQIKRALHGDEYVRKDERFKVVGLAISPLHLELWLLGMFQQMKETMGAVCDLSFGECDFVRAICLVRRRILSIFGTAKSTTTAKLNSI